MRCLIVPFVLAATLAPTLAAPAAAQIVADRPGFTTGVATVPNGRLQVEIGLPEATRSAEDGGAGRALFARTPVQVRLGLGPRWEGQVTLSPLAYLRTWGGTTPRTSTLDVDFSAVSVGAKVRLLDGGALPLTLAPSVEVPLEGGDVAVTALLATEWAFSRAASLSLTGGVTAAGGDVAVPLAASVGTAIGPRLSAYAEAAAFPSTGGSGGTWVGTGVALTPSGRVQLDASLQRRLDDDVWGFGAGVAVLF